MLHLHHTKNKRRIARCTWLLVHDLSRRASATWPYSSKSNQCWFSSLLPSASKKFYLLLLVVRYQYMVSCYIDQPRRRRAKYRQAITFCPSIFTTPACFTLSSPIHHRLNFILYFIKFIKSLRSSKIHRNTGKLLYIHPMAPDVKNTKRFSILYKYLDCITILASTIIFYW